MTGINRLRGTEGELWQPRFFDRALRTVKEYHERVEYIHLFPARAELVSRPHDWRWSSFNAYAGIRPEEHLRCCALTIDRVRIPPFPAPGFNYHHAFALRTRDADRKSGGPRYLL